MGEVEGGQGGEGEYEEYTPTGAIGDSEDSCNFYVCSLSIVEGRLTGTLVRPSDIYEGRHFHCRRPSTKQRGSRPLPGFVWQANCEGPTDIYCRKRDFMDEGLSRKGCPYRIITNAMTRRLTFR